MISNENSTNPLLIHYDWLSSAKCESPEILDKTCTDMEAAFLFYGGVYGSKDNFDVFIYQNENNLSDSMFNEHVHRAVGETQLRILFDSPNARYSAIQTAAVGVYYHRSRRLQGRRKSSSSSSRNREHQLSTAYTLAAFFYQSLRNFSPFDLPIWAMFLIMQVGIFVFRFQYPWLAGRTALLTMIFEINTGLMRQGYGAFLKASFNVPPPTHPPFSTTKELAALYAAGRYRLLFPRKTFVYWTVMDADNSSTDIFLLRQALEHRPPLVHTELKNPPSLCDLAARNPDIVLLNYDAEVQSECDLSCIARSDRISDLIFPRFYETYSVYLPVSKGALQSFDYTKNRGNMLTEFMRTYFTTRLRRNRRLSETCEHRRPGDREVNLRRQVTYITYGAIFKLIIGLLLAALGICTEFILYSDLNLITNSR